MRTVNRIPIWAYSIINLLLVAVCVLLINFGWSLSSDVDSDEATLNRQREVMVHQQIEARDIKDRHILNAMRTVKRHLFVPKGLVNKAYLDRPLPIGEGQTISQPYMVAIMTYLVDLKKDDVVLEIGTGSGYQAAVLAELVKEVYTIEINETLGKRAQKLLNGQLGYENIHVRIGDGYQGWPEHTPFDAIVVTAAPDHIPQPLIDQLKVRGRMVIPVGKEEQKLTLVEKTGDSAIHRSLIPVRFVPMTGEAEKH